MKVVQPNDIRRLGKKQKKRVCDFTVFILECVISLCLKKTGPTHGKSAPGFGLQIVVSYLCYYLFKSLNDSGTTQ